MFFVFWWHKTLSLFIGALLSSVIGSKSVTDAIAIRVPTTMPTIKISIKVYLIISPATKVK